MVPAEFVETALYRVFGIFVPTEQLRAFLQTALQQLELLLERRSAAGIAGMLALLWTASALLQSVRAALHVVFQLPPLSRGGMLLWARLRDMVLTLGLLSLTLIAAAVFVGWSVVAAWGTSFLPENWRGGLRWVLGTVVSIGVELLLFGFIFRFVPLVRLSGRQVAVAVVSAVVLTEVVRVGYVWYLEHVAPWGWIYGGYAAVVSLVVWAYVVALVILLSGTVSAVMSAQRRW
jgi:YihY family inner membrane protein